MAYDAYGHPQRGSGEPDYFEPNDSDMPAFSSHYNAEPREGSSSKLRASSNLRQSNNINNMTAAPDRTESSGAGTDVSPELIAAITERVKRERMCAQIHLALSLVLD